MSTPIKPSFISSVSERKKAERGISSYSFLPRYIDAYASRFDWEGLPPEVPPDYVERSLFFAPGIGAKKLRGVGPAVFPASAAGPLSIYDVPTKWLPMDVSTGTSRADIFEPSDGPLLWQGISMMERITPYVEVMRKALNALNQNMVVLGQPVLIETDMGNELSTKILKAELSDGDVFIPIMGRGTVPAQVIDLKANDYTHSLLGVIHDMDAQILNCMAFQTANEKASGISDLEASVSDSLVASKIKKELQLREAWADKVNDKLGMSISVRIAYNINEGDDDVGTVGDIADSDNNAL